LANVVLPNGGGTVSFLYDPFGRRIQKKLTQGASTTTNYLYDDSDLIEEIDSSGTVIARYTQGPRIDEPLAELRSGTTSFYEADGLHSATSLSNSTGALANTYTYDSYGKLTASTGTVTNPLTYTGRDFDSETAIYYYRARYYEPATGRFISEDPIRFKGGIDFYSYALSSPTNLTDPMGLCPPEGCQPPNTHSPQPRSKCSTYTDYEHRTACRVLAGDDTVGQCVRGCLLDQYDTKTHSYKCDESKLHCLCFDACGYTSGLRARAARYHFDCNQPSGPKTQ
jgi:RHS repeat-associated protein